MLTVDFAHVTRAVLALQRCTHPRLSILRGIHLSSDGHGLTLRASNMETEAIFTLPCEVDAPFPPILVDGKRFHAALKTLKVPKGAAVTLNPSDGGLNIRVRAVALSVPLMDEGEFLAPVDTAGTAPMPDLDAASFRDALARVVSCASKNPITPALQSVALHHLGEGYQLVATDGHRMGLEVLGTPTVEPHAAALAGLVLIPPGALKSLKALLKNANGPLKVSADSTRLALTAPGLCVVIRPTQANFPAYWRAIPALGALVNTLTLDRVAFAAGLCQVSTVLDEYSHNAKLNLAWPDLTLTAENANTGGKAGASMGFRCEGKMPDYLAFNAQYLADIAAQCEGAELTCAFKDDVGAGVWASPGHAFRVMLMPVRFVRVGG